MAIKKEAPCVQCQGGVPIKQPTTGNNGQSSANDSHKKDHRTNDDGILRIRHVLRSMPMNLNVLALPNKRHALCSWQLNSKLLTPDKLEHLRNIVEGMYMGINVKNCMLAINALRKKRDSLKKAGQEAYKMKSCCKEDCTMISLLLQRLKNINVTSERKSLTCIIFNELCKLSSIDPTKTQDENRNIALLVARKLGGWIDGMLAKTGTVTCGDMTLDPKAMELMNNIIECSCMKDKKPEEPKPEEAPPEESPKKEKKGKKGKGKKK